MKNSAPLEGYWNADERKYVVSLPDLPKFRLGDIPAHSTLSIIGLPSMPAPYEATVSVTNGGDAGNEEYLSIDTYHYNEVLRDSHFFSSNIRRFR
jgi:hypothetical protein